MHVRDSVVDFVDFVDNVDIVDKWIVKNGDAHFGENEQNMTKNGVFSK